MFHNIHNLPGLTGKVTSQIKSCTPHCAVVIKCFVSQPEGRDISNINLDRTLENIGNQIVLQGQILPATPSTNGGGGG
jgi:hypothetical protein